MFGKEKNYKANVVFNGKEEKLFCNFCSKSNRKGEVM